MSHKNTLESVLARTEIVDGCRVWKGCTHWLGYGEVRYHNRKWKVHRLIWTLIVGPIPDGMELDHLCRNRACCEVSHLEIVTHKENVRRGFSPSQTNKYKMYCKYGHPLFGDNLYKSKNQRSCRICQKRRRKEYENRLKEKQDGLST